MYTEIEKDEPEEVEVRYNQIRIPFVDLEKYKQAGWELVREEGLLAIVRKELKA